MKLVFDTQGNEKQKQCASAWLDDGIEEILYGGSKGGAKSYTGGSLIFGDALIYPKTHYFIARKKLKDLQRFTIPSIHEVLEHWDINTNMYRFNGSENVFNLYNDSKVYLIDAKYLPNDPQYQRFGSMQMTRGWIEEAGEFEYDSYTNLKISIGRWKNDLYGLKGKLLITANPSKNFLYKDFYKAQKNNTIEPWRTFIQALPYDNKMLSKGYLETLERTLKGAEKQRLLHGNWEYDDDPTAMCDYDTILSIFENDHIAEGKKYLTCDVARFGSDKARIGVWSGWKLIEVHSFDISKTTVIQECIKAMRMKHRIPKKHAIADADGVGGGVVDNCGILGFTNNAKAVAIKGQTENYKNLQVQCLYALAKKINDFALCVSCDLSEKEKQEIVEELEQLKTSNKNLNKLDTISKEEIKRNIGRSPDWRDMLLMRCFFDLPKTSVTTKRATLL